MLEADDEELFYEACGLIIPVEAGDDFHGFVGTVGDLKQVEVVGRDQFVAEQVFADVFIPGFPIRAAGPVHEHQRHKRLLPVCMRVMAS